MRPIQPRSILVRDGLGLASTDVVMNLFLFFVIAFALIATFQKKDPKHEQEKKTEASSAAATAGEKVKVIDLPRSASSLGDAEPGAVIVESDSSGGLFLDGAPLDRASLTATLQKRLGDSKRPVVLRAAKGLALGDAVELLDLINAAEPGGVSLSTVEKPVP